MGTSAEDFKTAKRLATSFKYMDVSLRREQLEGLLKLYLDNRDALVDSLVQEHKSPNYEARISVGYLIQDVKHILQSLKQWTEEEHIPKYMLWHRNRDTMMRVPFGLVLLVSAGCHPLHLALLPLAAAIAAGNCAFVHPSGIAPNTTKMIADMLPRYLDQEAYRVIPGGSDVLTDLLQLPFDHIMYQGPRMTGREVCDAAAQQMIPTTLIMHSKNPVYIDSTVDVNVATRRLLWSKCADLGQSCLSPDYLVCDSSVQTDVIRCAPDILKEWFGQNWRESPDMGRIRSDEHFTRLKSLLERTKGQVVVGGDLDASDRWVSPTIVANVPEDDPLMTEGPIMGPVLPIVICHSHLDASRMTKNCDPTHLVAYLFTASRIKQVQSMYYCDSGTQYVNDCMGHVPGEDVPLTAKGWNGWGTIGGKHTFEALSRKKGIISNPIDAKSETRRSHRYPPYFDRNQDWEAILDHHSIRHHPSLLLQSVWGAGVALVAAAVLIVGISMAV